MCCQAVTGRMRDPRRHSSPVILCRVADGNGGGEQGAAGPLLAACRTPGDALYLYTAQGGRRGWWW
jgi:hypothetical protein